jgi:hypothetical protein
MIVETQVGYRVELGYGSEEQLKIRFVINARLQRGISFCRWLRR